MERGEIKPDFFRVTFYIGYEPTEIRYFKTLENAREYAKKLIKDLKEIAKTSDDYDWIEITDEELNTIESWRAEEGKVVHYPNGW